MLFFVKVNVSCVQMASRQKWVWFAVRQTVLVVAAAGLLWGRYAVMATGPPTFQRMDNPASFAENWITRVRAGNRGRKEDRRRYGRKEKKKERKIQKILERKCMYRKKPEKGCCTEMPIKNIDIVCVMCSVLCVSV